MANVLLIDPPWYALQNIEYNKVSYALSSLAAVLENNGHNCVVYSGDFGLSKPPYNKEEVIIDFDLYRLNLEGDSLIWRQTWGNIKSIINSFNPFIVGITMPTAKYSIALKLAGRIKKEFPGVVIVAGGPHPTILPLEVIKEPPIDVVVKGEGEQTFLELVNAASKGADLANIHGVVFKSGPKICDNPAREYIKDLDDLPFPAWHRVYEFKKHRPDNFGSIFTSRGCPFRCIYCASFKIWSREVRYMSPDRVVAELQHAYREYKTNFFRFNDDTFILDKKRVAGVCEKIKKSGLNIKWMCEVRADSCTYDILKIMKSAGCVQVNIGVESGNPEILKYTEKGITVTHIHNAFEAIRKAGLSVCAYFMLGFPGETAGQAKDTLNLMNKLKADYPCWSIVTSYPGTKLYETVSRGEPAQPEPDWSCFFHHSPAVCLSKEIGRRAFLNLIRKIEKNMRKLRRWKSVKLAFFILLFNPAEFIRKTYKRIARPGFNLIDDKFV